MLEYGSDGWSAGGRRTPFFDRFQVLSPVSARRSSDPQKKTPIPTAAAAPTQAPVNGAPAPPSPSATASTAPNAIEIMPPQKNVVSRSISGPYFPGQPQQGAIASAARLMAREAPPFVGRMVEAGDRRIGSLFGILGAILLGASGLLEGIRGVVDLAIGRGSGAFTPIEGALVLIVFALIVGFFSILGRSPTGDRSLLAGGVLIVLALVGWLLLGTATGVLALLGTLCALVAGVVFLLAGR